MTSLADALLLPRLCSFLPTIAPQNPRKPRLCVTCRRQYPAPCRCPLDGWREGRALDQDPHRTRGGEHG